MATLAQSCRTQFGLPSALANALNEGRDPHRMVAALATGKAEAEVTSDERRRVAALLVAGMRMVVPDVRIAVDYALATSWAKQDRVGEAAVVSSDKPDIADVAAGASPDVVSTRAPGRRRPGRTPRRSR